MPKAGGSYIFKASKQKTGKAILRDRRGVSLVSYGLVVGLIAVLAIGVVSDLGGQVTGLFTSVGSEMDEAVLGQGGSGSGGSSSSGGSSGAPPAPSISFSQAAFTLAEGNSGTTDFTFTLTRSGDTSEETTVTLSISALDTDAADFGGSLPSPAPAVFPAGSSADQDVTIQVFGDTDMETDEDFSLSIDSVSGSATIGAIAASTATIRNDEVSVAFSSADLSIAEGDSGTTDFTYTLARTGDVTQETTVTLTFSAGDTDAADFGGSLPTPGPVVFPASSSATQDVTIQVSGDVTGELDEDFTLSINSISPTGTAGSPSSRTGTILTDDTIILTGSGSTGDPYRWTDGSLASSCETYRRPSAGYSYTDNPLGSGVYLINPGSGSIDVYCDQTGDSGGWTRVMNFNSVSDLPLYTTSSHSEGTNPTSIGIHEAYSKVSGSELRIFGVIDSGAISSQTLKARLDQTSSRYYNASTGIFINAISGSTSGMPSDAGGESGRLGRWNGNTSTDYLHHYASTWGRCDENTLSPSCPHTPSNREAYGNWSNDVWVR